MQLSLDFDTPWPVKAMLQTRLAFDALIFVG